MSVITVRDLSVTFGATEIFGGVSFTLEPRQRLAVVGGNGAGKSSLLEVITGHLPPTAGTVDLPSATRLAYLPQELVVPSATTVYEEALASRQDLLQLRRELTELEQRMAAPNAPGLPRLLERYGDQQHRYEQLGGYDLEHRTRAVLGGLGFSESDQGQPPGELSGGQQRRLGLAKLLLQDANVLLLDEPTNHLDLAAIEWLEEFLRVSPAAMLVVSHDRRFLDKVADHVLELAGGRGESYPGNYTRYVRLRAERRARRQAEFDAQQAHIAHQEAFIQRYRAGQRAREARGRQKQLDNLARVERPHEPDQINVQLKAAESSRHVLESSTGLTFGFPGQVLGQVPAFNIVAGERLAIVGPNGVGKTTLLRTLMGEQKALKGKLRLGARVKLRYYDQHLGDLDPTKTVVEELQSAHPLPAEAARNFLARLLFTGDDAFKRVASLSGGEKSRLALAKLMLDNANLLLLDEPTNHLDIPSQEVLEEALGDFAGTIIFVSHDRYFIDRIATAVWRLEAGGLRAYTGNYTDSQKIRARQDAVAPAPAKAAPAKETPAKGTPGRSRDARQRATAQLEQEIEALEQQLGTIEQALADGRTYDQADRVVQLTREFEAINQTLQERYRVWEDLANPA